MSKPLLSQIVEIASQQGYFFEVIEGDKYHFVQCEDAVEMFGDVEIKDLGFNLSLSTLISPCNEFKTTLRVFI
ncbi:MAG: hypothetical protein IJ085_02965 [Turicibacter sp.]|nr:hypothetical protein [Turicibacter sp.]